MKYFVTGLFIGLVVGLVIATSEPDLNYKQINWLQVESKEIKTPIQRSQWRTASLFPSSTFPSGRSVQNLVKNINFLTRTTLELKLFEPGTLVPVPPPTGLPCAPDPWRISRCRPCARAGPRRRPRWPQGGATRGYRGVRNRTPRRERRRGYRYMRLVLNYSLNLSPLHHEVCRFENTG